MASTEEEIPVESAPPAAAATEPAATSSSKTDEILKVVDDSEEPDDYVEHIEHVTPDDEDDEDDNEDWKEILPPPPAPVKAEDVDEKYESHVQPATPATVATTTTASVVPPAKGQKQQQQQPKQDENAEPDFSNCKTNVGKRLWLAQEKAEKAGQKASPEMVPLTKEFQVFRKQMNQLIRCIDEYQDAMRVMKAKRTQLFDQYAVLAKGTPIWDHVGKPLSPEQVAEIQNRGNEITPDSIKLQSQSIAKVADEIGEGSLIAFQQLAAMQDKLDELDYHSHIVDYIDEWDDVVMEQGDDAIKKLLEVTKKREHYVHKVDNLRKKVNKIERRGVRDAPNGLSQKLDRNEDKLEKIDDIYEDKANDVTVMLNESVRRQWVDLYPLIKNAMKFETNRLARESSTYGRLKGTMDGLKRDYKEAVKGTDDAL